VHGAAGAGDHAGGSAWVRRWPRRSVCWAVSTIVMSLWLLDEPMGPAQIAGTVLVLIGVFW
jgi:hypothetical protein